MMKQKEIVSVLLLMLSLLFIGCSLDEPDGKWPNMKWVSEVDVMSDNGVYLLYQEGGSFTFECKNYGHPWISNINIDGAYQEINYENPMSFKGEWLEVEMNGNLMTIIVDPLPDSLESRDFELDVTAGDIFHHFKFSQRQNIHPWM
ncbi:MAG: hypothetical protein IJK41_06560 [Muribaculaceae bacterium]|nr:hypothetical protein [Muribaculaceae bacterium]